MGQKGHRAGGERPRGVGEEAGRLRPGRVNGIPTGRVRVVSEEGRRVLLELLANQLLKGC